MPIYDLTYRGWKGERTKLPAWYPILENTVRLALRNKFLLTIFRFCWVPSLIACGFLYIRYSFEAGGFGPRGRRGRGGPDFSFDLPSYFKFLAFQGGLAILIAGLVGSAAIAGDRRGNTLETLFSRAITRRDYLWGRFLGLFCLVFGATLIPGILIWLCDNMFSLDPDRLSTTLSYPAKIAGWALVLSTSVSLLVLACSALIQRAWLAVAAFGAFLFLSSFVTQAVAAVLDRGRLEDFPNFIRGFGYFEAIASVQRAIFGITAQQSGIPASPVAGTILLVVVFLASIAILRWRVRPIEVVS